METLSFTGTSFVNSPLQIRKPDYPELKIKYEKKILLTHTYIGTLCACVQAHVWSQPHASALSWTISGHLHRKLSLFKWAATSSLCSKQRPWILCQVQVYLLPENRLYLQQDIEVKARKPHFRLSRSLAAPLWSFVILHPVFSPRLLIVSAVA